MPTDDASLRAVLALLHERHGVGTRTERCPGWMEARLSRALDEMAARVGATRTELARSLEGKDALLRELADTLRVGETSFFRDAPQWTALRSAVLPDLARSGRVRALSVGCSTGEEAWSLAMCVDEAVDQAGGDASASIVGIDRSAEALDRAAAATYPREASRDVPGPLKSRYFDEDGELVRIKDALRRSVKFVQRDVMQGVPPGTYEVIVCKNVLIYFGEEAGVRVVDALLGALADGGFLLVARSEIPRLRAMGKRGVEIGPQITAFTG